MLAAGMTLFVLAALALANRPAGSGVTSISGDGSIQIATSDIRPGDAKFFEYRDRDGGRIRFILARDDKGHIQAALDACERCYVHHQGYGAAHGELTCRYCGNRYRVAAIASGMGSCVPVKLPFQAEGQAVRIKTAELERQRQMFE